MAEPLNKDQTFRIRRNLTRWYRENHRLLPWRESRDPYHIWVSEVMLQQTQVKTVVDYYLRFIQRFPDITSLAESDLQAVLKCWEGLGYYARARNLHRAAQIVAREHNATVPDNWDIFRELPGVGDYIAAAVQSIAFGHAHAVVDGNVKRVLSRLACIETPINLPAAHKVFKSLAESLLDREDPSTFNQAMMELGALVCRPDSPACPQCPLMSECRSHQTRQTAHFPIRQKPKPTPTHDIAVGVVLREDRVLITRRAPEGLLGGLWEFPGGKIEPGETGETACRREIREEVGIEVEPLEILATVNHAYTHFKIKLQVFICRFVSGEICLAGPVDHRWVSKEELDQYPFPKANLKFFSLLKKYLSAFPATPANYGSGVGAMAKNPIR